ncbi:TonB-dependent receptor [Emcibacter sp. SYSU 3D8]|uniref:TonB-dependent receptor family protein n=1 Tax=Emcibacter sp. SYSU 3D8 TaxID=3133969 RepID=UPI0031FEA59E
MNHSRQTGAVIVAMGILLGAGTTRAAEAEPQPAGAVVVADMSRAIDRITVVGSRQEHKVPGSAHLIDADQLETFEYTDIHRMLRMVPGVNIQEEDGYGLRPNIGLRGSGTERSERITLMEDGVLIAPAPYAAPAAYYFPIAARMSAIEVTKGPSAIKYGPRTVGGAINLLSTPIPDASGGRIEARYGSDNFYAVHGVAAAVGETLAVMGEGYISGADGFKKLDGGGNTGFEVQDFVGKLRWRSSDSASRVQSLEIKLGYTNNDSDESYLGLTDADFAATPFRRYAASRLDNINTEHKQVQATHFIELSSSVDLTTVAYYNHFKRDWFKLDRINYGGTSFSPAAVFEAPGAYPAVLAILRGDMDSPDGALSLRHNNRKYDSWGIQSVLGVALETGAASHALEIGLRWHEDEEDRLQNDERFSMLDGDLVRTAVDPIGSNANREAKGKAFAAFIQDDISLGRWTFRPGVRFEHIDLSRLDYAGSDPDRVNGPTRIRKNSLDVVIPGFGVTFDAAEGLVLLAGVNRGFAPPGAGTTDASEERSWNFEAGLRYNGQNAFLEVIGFYNNYSNILGTCSNATGCTGGDIGDQFNGGAAEIKGIEVLGGYVFDLGGGLTVPLNFNYTYTDATFSTSFSDSFWGSVAEGDELPYTPHHQVYLSAGLEAADWGVVVSMNHLGAIRTEAGSGPIPASQRVKGHTVFDLAAHYQLTETIRLFASAENLFDKTYPVARQPYGLRPGKPLTVTGGVSLSF